VIRAVPIALLLLALTPGCTGGEDHAPATTLVTPPVASASPEVTPAEHAQGWRGTIVSRSEHRLYVGGTCGSDWRTSLVFSIAADGAVSGRAVARLTSHGDPCPFPTAQVQIREFDLEVEGRLRGRGLRIRLLEVDHSPTAGADDLGGLRVTTLGTSLHLAVKAGGVHDRIALQAPDQDRGTFSSTNIVDLSCRNC
jgi:hypothetical protein